MKLWVDDVRPAPDGWKWVKSSGEAIATLTFFQVDEISLDHDLGISVTGNHDGFVTAVEDETAKTGYDIACWIEARVHSGVLLNAPIMHCHSANPVGRRRIEQVIRKLGAGK